MTQEPLDFGRSDRIAHAHKKLLRTVSDVVSAIGLLQAAGACDCRKSELHDALEPSREDRYMRTEWLLAILDAASREQRQAIVDALTMWVGLVAVPVKVKTPEERLAELEQKVATQFGPAGAALVEELRR